MKRILMTMFVFLILSCNQNKYIVVFDKYFPIINDLDKSDLNYKLVDFETFDIMELMDYNEIYISPLIYKFYKSTLYKYNGKVFIIDGVENYSNDKVKNIIVSDEKAYSEFVNIINDQHNPKYKKISIIIDSVTDSKKNEIEILNSLKEHYDVNYLLVSSITTSSSVKLFIRNNSDTDLWVIDTKKMGLYSYELIEETKIFFLNNEALLSSDMNVLYSTKLNFNKELLNVIKGESKIIYTVLKKR